MKIEDFFDLLPDDPLWGEHCFAPGKDNVQIHYIRKGSGIPVLLLHGWPGFWYDWRRIIPSLSEYGDVIAPDFRGYGKSDKPLLPAEEAYTPDIFAQDILSLMDHLKLDQFIIAAYDIGATVAQIIARTTPQRVCGMLLMGPSYAGIGLRRYEPAAQREFWYQHFHNLSWSDELVSYNRDTLKIYLSHFYNEWMAQKEQLRPIEFEAIVDMYAQPGAFKASIQYYRARAASRLRDAMSSPLELRIDTPTDILWGEEDIPLSSKWADRLPEFFPNCDIQILPGIGHFVPLEAAEEVTGHIKKIIEKQKHCR